MSPLSISRNAIYSLHCLSREVTRHTGCRCKLGNTRQLLKLLRFASICGNALIRRCYLRFLQQLSLRQLRLLARYGVQLPVRVLEKMANKGWFQQFSNWIGRLLRPVDFSAG